VLTVFAQGTPLEHVQTRLRQRVEEVERQLYNHRP
jgi:hypothetical protein